jgi:transposase-like protein
MAIESRMVNMPSKYKPGTKQITAKSQKGQELPNWNEDQARAYFEARRWPSGPACIHCGSVNVYRVGGNSHRAGLIECRDCKKQFTVTVGTVMEDSHLPLVTWAKAFHYLATSKKGFSALQLQRNCGIGSYRTAWFLAHRVREAMRCEPLAGRLKGEVQVDETFIGGKPRKGDGPVHKRGRGTDKTPVVALVETGGKAIARPIGSIDSTTMTFLIHGNVEPSAKIVTDENSVYPKAILAAGITGGHESINHGQGEYVRKSDGINTNSAESFFGLIKRGHYGVYHKMSKKHLRRYTDEFSFRWNGRQMSDVERRDAAVDGSEGKRLYYKTPVKSGAH